MRWINNLLNSKKVMNEIARSSDLLFEMSDVQREELKGVLLHMLLDIKSVCEKKDIPFFLLYGTALGAVRHKGFIPWDDDIDIGMTRKDYDKFCRIFAEELGEKYILNAPNYCQNAKTRFPKILLKGTVFRDIVDSKDESLCAVYLDLFILENLPDKQILRLIKGVYCNALEFIAGQVSFLENKDEAAKKFYLSAGASNYYVRILIGKLFSFRRSAKWFDTIDKAVRYDSHDTKFFCIPTGRKHYFGEWIEKSKVFPASIAVFEKHEFQVFSDIDSYLTIVYGNYMQIPPENQRERHFVREVRL